MLKQKTAYEVRSRDWSSDVCSPYPVGNAQQGVARRLRPGQFPATLRHGDGEAPDLLGVVGRRVAGETPRPHAVEDGSEAEHREDQVHVPHRIGAARGLHVGLDEFALAREAEAGDVEAAQAPILLRGRMVEDAAIGEIGQRMAEGRTEEHTSELQSLMRILYAVFCL